LLPCTAGLLYRILGYIGIKVTLFFSTSNTPIERDKQIEH